MGKEKRIVVLMDGDCESKVAFAFVTTRRDKDIFADFEKLEQEHFDSLEEGKDEMVDWFSMIPSRVMGPDDEIYPVSTIVI